MKFIVDAHLSKKISSFLNDKEHDSIHTLDLPNKNKTSDKALKRPKPIPISLSGGHVVANAIRFSTYDKAFFSKKWKTKKGKKYEVILIDLYDPKKKR